MKKNILREFLKRIAFTIVFLSFLSAASIYFFQKNQFDENLANEIKKHIQSALKVDFKEFKLLDKKFIRHMKMIDFILFDLYDAKQNKIYTFSKPSINRQSLKFIKEHTQKDTTHFPVKNKIYYEFFEARTDEFFIHISHAIYKNDILLGYINGVKVVPQHVIKAFKKDVIYTISMIFFSIFLFSLFLFPIIYLAYKELKQNTSKLLTNNIMTINTLGNAIALRDSDTNEHNYRVTIYAINLAQKVSLDKEQIKKLIIGAFLHDVGKIGISDTILLKKAKLSDEEFEIMKEHVNKGIDLIKNNEWLQNANDVILYHHEKYDGSGYPNGIKAKNIPKIARIFSIVDVFDALTSKRPYKEPFSYQVTKDIMYKSIGTHFDEKLLIKFFEFSQILYSNIMQKSQIQLKEELDSLMYHYFLNDK